MPLGPARRRRSIFARLVVCGALLGATALGCHPGRTGPTDPSEFDHSLPPVDVRDADFAASVHRLMRDGTPSAERSALLAGVVRRQLSHAAQLFRDGHESLGANAVLGALYLVRAGEARPDMFDGDGLVALRGAFARFSAVGDEGRALALLAAQRSMMDPGTDAVAQLAEHQASLDRWMADTRPGSKMQQLAVDMRLAVASALLRPSNDTLESARRAIDAWVARAVEINLAYQRTRKPPRRAVILDAYRALQLGSETLAAVYLRHGRANDAAAALDEGAAGRVADARFLARLQSAAQGDSAEDWRLLSKALQRRVLDDDEVRMDGGLLAAATWGISLEAYRRDTSSFRIAHALATHLTDYGMPEVSPLVLGDALGLEPSTVSLSGVLRVIERSLETARDRRDLQTARRVFDSSGLILQIADRARYRTRVKPSAAALRHLMARIELRAGQAETARKHMIEALQAAPTLRGYVDVAILDGQAGKHASALAHANRALKLADTTPNDVLGVAHAHLAAFDAARASGDRAAALAAVTEALTLLVKARSRGPTPQRVRAEILLARALDGFGHADGGSRALNRALTLASADQSLMGEVILATMMRALVVEDVRAARATLQAGFEAQAARVVMVRAALWLMLLELRLDVPPDGKAERVLADTGSSRDWWAVAARWGSTYATDAELRKVAGTHAARVRSAFYVLMKNRAKQRGGATVDDELRKIASDPLFWLPEVELARALLVQPLNAPVPVTVDIP